MVHGIFKAQYLQKFSLIHRLELIKVLSLGV